MSSSNNDYKNGNNSGMYPLSLYLSSFSSQEDIIHNTYNHQLTASPSQMVSAVPGSLTDYMAFNSKNDVNQQSFGCPYKVSSEIKKTVKKDRHSKIHTAQGLRDRRVRLSIGIARQFFDLQDMLGFDKASKTLEWLLKKSRKAIKELVKEKNLNNDDAYFGNIGGDVEEEEEDDDDDGNKSFMYGSSPEYCAEEVVCEVKKADKIQKKSELSTISSNGSRAKPKGKEKELTRETTYDLPETVSEITQSETMEPFRRSITFNEGENITHSFYMEAIERFDNQESIVTKTKINLPTNMDQSYNQHDGTFMLLDQGSSSDYSTILPQNLDFDYVQNPFIDQPFRAATDTNFLRGFP